MEYKLVTPFSENDRIGIDGENLHLVGYRLMMLHQIKNDWRIIALFNPVVSSTFSTALENDDFLFNGALQFIKKKTEKLSYGGGLMFTSRFGNPILLPTLRLTLSSDKSKFQIILPTGITYDLLFGKLTAGLQASVDGSLYNVNYTINSGNGNLEPVDKIAYTRVLVGPSISYRFGKIFQFSADTGITLARKLELESDVFEDQTNDVENAPYFRFGIAIVPPAKDQ